MYPGDLWYRVLLSSGLFATTLGRIRHWRMRRQFLLGGVIVALVATPVNESIYSAELAHHHSVDLAGHDGLWIFNVLDGLCVTVGVALVYAAVDRLREARRGVTQLDKR